MKNRISLAVFLVFGLISSANAQAVYSIFNPTTIQWTEGPKTLPPQARMAVLAGNPKVYGPFTLRLKLPAHYQIPAHAHPSLEQVTVISGDFHVGAGDALTTAKGDTLHAGSFVAIQPNTHHYAWTNSGAIIQLNGMGPWDIHYVDAKNDPRTKQ